MASSLSDLGSAGRQDVIPGHTLSKPRTYTEGAEAEKLATAWFLETVAASVKGLDPKLAEVVLLSAKADIMEGKLRYRSFGFNRWALSPASLPVLLQLSTRPKHGNTVTIAMVAQWLIDFDADKIAAAVHELWGYVPQKATRWRREPEPINWEQILKRLISPAPDGLDLPIERAMELTDSQLSAILGGEPDPKKVIEEKMFGWFEAICDTSGRQPTELEKLDDGELTYWMRFTEPEDRKGMALEIRLARPYLAMYVAACGQ